MQFDDLHFPPSGAGEPWVEDLNSREDVAITIPLSVEHEGTANIAGACICSEDALTFVYYEFETQRWNLYTEYELENEITVWGESLLQPEVGLRAQDARVGHEIAMKFGERLMEIYRMGFAPYVRTGMAEKFSDAMSECDCESIGESRVKVVEGTSRLGGSRVYLCTDCMRTYGIEYEGRPIRNERVFNADWVLDGECPNDFVEIGEEDNYLLYSEGGSAGKLEYAIALMSNIGGGVSESFSPYDPENQQALIYVRDGELAGYLTWTIEMDGVQALQQLFTRSEYRREGVATTLIETWAENYCEGGIFYAEEPNEKSRALFKKLGYWENDGDPHAVEHYTLRGVSNSLDEGMKVDESMAL